ncbi:MAG: DMT family transporter [Gemmatimonadota bacterium]
MSSGPGGLRYMAAAALSFSLMSVLVKVAGRTLPTMEIVLARSVIITVLTWVTLRRRRTELRGREPKLLLLRGLLGFVALSCFFYGVVVLPLADVTVIQYTNPVFTALFAVPVLGESLRVAEVVLAFASLAGVVMVAQPDVLFSRSPAALDPTAVGIALCGAVFSAAAYVTVRRLKGEDPVLVVFYFGAFSTVASLPAVVPIWRTPDALGWVVLLGVGLATHLGQLCLTLGLHRERAGRAMTVAYLQIVFAALWGVVFFGEIPDTWSVVGGLVIVACTFLVARLHRPAGSPRGAETPPRPGS